MLDEKKGTCCHKCGHVHVKGTSCPTPFRTGKRSCVRKNLKEVDLQESNYLKKLAMQSDISKLTSLLNSKGYELKKGDIDLQYTVNPGFKSEERIKAIIDTVKSVFPSAKINSGTGKNIGLIVIDLSDMLPIDEVSEYCTQCLIEYLQEYANKLEEAEYRGRKVKLGKPFLTPGGPKKRAVYVKNAKGNVVKVNFGDPNLRIKKNIPARRRSFRARHKCDTPGPRWKARYWSCKAW